LILGEAHRTIMPQNWHASAKDNEGKENEKRRRYTLCTYLIISTNYVTSIKNKSDSSRAKSPSLQPLSLSSAYALRAFTGECFPRWNISLSLTLYPRVVYMFL